MISKEEAAERLKRQNKLVELINKYSIRTSRLALITGIRENNLSSMKSGKVAITEETFKALIDGISKLVQEDPNSPEKPNVEVEDWDYVIQALKLHRNVWINKSKVKNIEQYISDLKLNGFDCTYTTDSDGSYIITNDNKHRPMVESTVKPKQQAEAPAEQIAKVRKAHEDALKLEPVKEVIKHQEVVTGDSIDLNDPKHKMPEYAPGGTIEFIDPNFVPSTKTYSPMDDIQITITEEDIVQAVEHNQKMMHSLPPEEEAELKELAEEVLANCGLEKGIHTLDLIKFLETRSSKQEVGGFIRFKAIESLLEEDYQTASMCINYFMDNGYVPEEMRL